MLILVKILSTMNCIKVNNIYFLKNGLDPDDDPLENLPDQNSKSSHVTRSMALSSTPIRSRRRCAGDRSGRGTWVRSLRDARFALARWESCATSNSSDGDVVKRRFDSFFMMVVPEPRTLWRGLSWGGVVANYKRVVFVRPMLRNQN